MTLLVYLTNIDAWTVLCSGTQEAATVQKKCSRSVFSLYFFPALPLFARFTTEQSIVDIPLLISPCRHLAYIFFPKQGRLT